MVTTVTSQDARTAAISAAVERLATAAGTRVPCAAVRDLIGTDDLDAAYAEFHRGLRDADR